jgi:hypothetical protein
MKYNTAIGREKDAAKQYFNDLVATESIIEIKKVSPKRSIKQNSYLHLLLGAFGDHFGYTIEEAKLIYKEINRSIYFYKKKERTFIRSSADLSVEEMKDSIDRFREKSAESGCPLPLATDQDWLRSIENVIEQNRYNLGG